MQQLAVDHLLDAVGPMLHAPLFDVPPPWRRQRRFSGLVKLLSMSSGDLDDFGLGEPGVDEGLHVGVAGEAAFDA